MGRLLPARVRRNYYDPALADLDYAAAERSLRRASAATRARNQAAYGASVVWLLLECGRLGMSEAIVGAVVPQPGPTPSARKVWRPMMLRDLRQALRVFGREPGFAAAVGLTLALGIGANTALFAVVDAVLLRPLPYPDADRIVLVKHRDLRTGLSKDDLVDGDFVDLSLRQQSFEAFAGYHGYQGALLGEGEPVRVEGVSLTPAAFDVLGLHPVMGRAFEAADVQQGAAPIAIVSYELWRTTLGSDPNVLSRSIQLDGQRRLVVGVAPPGFRFPPRNPTDVIVPNLVPAVVMSPRHRDWVYGVAKLKAGVTVAAADAELTALSQQFEREYPKENLGTRYFALSLRDALVGDTKRPLLLLLASVGFVLLIACANVGNLLLARSLARQQEMAMRLALGAGRARLVSQTLAEGVVLALAGGAVGVLVAWRAAPVLARLVPHAVTVPGLDQVGLNVAVLGFSVAAAVAAAVVSSAVACLGLVRDADRLALAGQRRTTDSGRARRAASSLVAAEIALAVVLLIGAGLTLRSFAKLLAVDPGFSADGVVTLDMRLPAQRYEAQPARSAAYARILTSIAALPGVEAAGAAAVIPLTGNNWTAPMVRPEHPLAPGQRPPEVGWQSASGGYFEALHIPLRAGRLFDRRDTGTSSPVVIVSDALADHYFPGEDPVGKRVAIGTLTAEIVGRVGNIRRAALTDTPREDLYFPFERANGTAITLFVRTSGDPMATLPAIRAAIRQAEADTAVFEVRALADIAAASAATSRLAMQLLGWFALIAVVLAAVGIYGVMSYTVRRRSRELGTRLALGATRADILALVMRQAATLASIGLVTGLVVGLVAARSLSGVLYGIAPWDPAAVVGAGLVLTVAALGASYVPAWRASRLDPATTLAAE